MNLFERDIAVDMGTSSTLLFEQGKGVVAREPTVVAVDKFSGRILKIGQEAQRMLGRTPANIVAIHPINAGVISDYEITAQMLRELVNRITSFSLFKPCILACVPSSITGVDTAPQMLPQRTPPPIPAPRAMACSKVRPARSRKAASRHWLQFRPCRR